MSDSVNNGAGPSVSSHPQVVPLAKSTTPEDLLAIYEAEDATKTSEVDTEAEKQAKIQEEVPKKIVANKLKKQLDDTNKETEPEGDSTADVSKETKTQAAARLFKAKHGDVELDIPEDAEIPLVVNGKNANFKVKDIIQDFSNLETRSRQLDQRFSRATSREKAFETDLSHMQAKVGEILTKVESGDVFTAIKFLGDFCGKNPADVERVLFENVDKISAVWGKMSKQERENYLIQRKSEFLEKQLTETNQKVEFDKGIREIKSTIQTFCKQENITEEDYLQLYQELVNSKVKPESEIVPEDVIGYMHGMQHFGRVVQALESIDPKLAEDRDLFKMVVDLTKEHSDWTVEDLQKVIRDAITTADPQTVENLNRKVQKSKISVAGPGQGTSKKEDEIEEDLNNFFFGKRTVTRR